MVSTWLAERCRSVEGPVDVDIGVKLHPFQVFDLVTSSPCRINCHWIPVDELRRPEPGLWEATLPMSFNQVHVSLAQRLHLLHVELI